MYIYIYIYMYIYIVQSADMHVSAFYTSSVQLGTRLVEVCIGSDWTFIIRQLANV